MSKIPSSIASAYAEMTTVQIPQHWSPEQALAVWEFLDELSGRVWNRYELQLTELLHADLEQDDDTQPDLFDPDDTIPF
jgi:hypothetical protein